MRAHSGIFNIEAIKKIMRGWVYIITNKGFDGLVKIGFSERPPEFRAKELGNAGSPYSCVVQYEILVEDPRKVEQTIHRHLSSRHENKEWFRCEITAAIQSVKKIARQQIIFETNHHKNRATGPTAWEDEFLDFIHTTSKNTKKPFYADIIKYKSKLHTLSELNLYGGCIEELPDSIGKLSSLKRLVLMDNKISKIPDTIGGLLNLTEIIAGGNKISALPANIANLTKLQCLYLQQNRISKIPVGIGNLKKLKTLSLFVNNISDLPDDFGGLENLEQLWLTGNKLKFLPDGFKNLTKLTELTLDYNDFSEFPECLFQLENLQSLSIAKNNIKTKPKIKQFSNLTKLSV
jgi:T5orf172 domain/Leucine rich repeat